MYLTTNISVRQCNSIFFYRRLQVDQDPRDCVLNSCGHDLSPYSELRSPPPIPPGTPSWASDHAGAPHSGVDLRSISYSPHYVIIHYALQLYIYRGLSGRKVQIKV